MAHIKGRQYALAKWKWTPSIEGKPLQTRLPHLWLEMSDNQKVNAWPEVKEFLAAANKDMDNLAEVARRLFPTEARREGYGEQGSLHGCLREEEVEGLFAAGVRRSLPAHPR